MKHSRTSSCRAMAGAMLLSAATAALAFLDPSAEPALPSALAVQTPLLATVSHGDRIVGVGQRGHVVVSADGGKTWHQGRVPVSNDLLAVSFPSPGQGWAVGHGGVVIHSADGGATWERQLTGKAASEIAIRYFEDRVKSGDGDAGKFLDREKNLAAEGGTQPFMDVFFASDQVGYVVGTFNRIFRTGDGGRTWTPLMDKVDNPNELHFYSVRGHAGSVYLTGEQGKVWVLEAATGQFAARPTSYDGTLFGSVVAGDGSLVVFGMRGSVFRSGDQGSTWSRVDLGNPAGINAGARLANGDVVLASLAGAVLVSSDGGRRFTPRRMSRPMSYFGVTALPGNRLALAGAEGVRIEQEGKAP